MKRLGCILFLLTICSIAFAQNRRLVVATDGSGNFKTVQAAINAVPDSSSQPTEIFIKKGIYKEKLVVPANKINIVMIGEDEQSTVLTYDDYHARLDANGKEIGTTGSASVHIYGAGFTALNLTFQNTAGIRAGQAVAMWVGSDKARFINCRFLGFQDTLYTFGGGNRQYFDHCYIEGTVDFIFGHATAWFEQCTVVALPGAGYYTAAATPDTVKYGYVFNKCDIGGTAPAGSVCLGRPWRPYAKVAYISCKLGVQVKPEGWNNWGNFANEKTAIYAEYKSTGEGANASSRAAWSHQLTDEQVKEYTIQNVLGGNDHWNPVSKSL